MSVFTYAPMRAALPQAVARPQQRLTLSLPSFEGMRVSRNMPCMQPAGEKAQCVRPCSPVHSGVPGLSTHVP